jgi:predicted DNA-binding antitoxin AbrB/MazE fold protein
MTMATAIKAIYEHGVFRPVTPVHLREETEVEVLVPPDAAKDDDDDPTGWKAVEGLIGIIKDAPPDMAENHDHYLYGWPRK